MLKKNTNQKRFHTAGARIPQTHKLPSDFFRSGPSQRQGQLWSRQSSKYQPENDNIIRSRIAFSQNAMDLTFHKSGNINIKNNRDSSLKELRSYKKSSLDSHTKLPLMNNIKQNLQSFRKKIPYKLNKISNNKQWVLPITKINKFIKIL